MITDNPITATRLPGAEIELRGLSTGAITYQAAAAGHFADGITMWTGYGADTIFVDGTHVRNLAVPGGALRTITTLNTGLGDDRVIVDLDTVEDDFFVLNTQGPFNQFWSFTDKDTVDAQASTLPLVIFGGQDNDWIRGGSAGDLIFGDRGRVLFFVSPSTVTPITSAIGDATIALLEVGAVTVLGHGGPGDKTDGVVRPLAIAVTVDRTIGGTDTIYGIGGEDVLIGGAAGDRVDGGTERDLVFGDNVGLQRLVVGDTLNPRFRTVAGVLYGPVGEPLVGSAFQSDPSGTPLWNDYVITLLDHDVATQTANGNNFGADYLAGGAGNDVLFGQLGNDTIQGDGSIDLAVSPTAPSVDATSDGDDYVEGGGGNDLIFGNLGQDDLIGGSSSLFSLATPDRRPDGADVVYGGSGTMTALDNPGLTTVGGHARDADTITGDNANIFRVVAAGAYRRFAYDTYAGTLRIIVRAVQLLDYSPTGDLNYISTNPNDQAVSTVLAGTNANIGGGDFLHGESGDDVIHGQTGSDRIWGDGQDDDLYGESNFDWLSGGTGDDGLLGDDGVLLTSRNGVAEPLYGIAATTQTVLSVPGDQQTTTIYSNLALRKEANLEPFYIGNNDVMYGGLGDDWLHGGAGDDAMSGAEALASYYTADPLATLAALSAYYAVGNVLQHAYRPAQPEEFRWFNENDPWRKIMVAPTIDFLLNFRGGTTAVPVDDGQDVLFGDTGHDWLVGGTNHDRMYGGYGDDLLQGDDNLDSTAGTADPLRNDIPDTRASAPVFADMGFGGAGYDVIIVNTAVDRMYDWNGEFNSYFASFNPYGEPTVSRLISPATVAFLYAVSRSDGADRTRPGDAARNGEPSGEMGLVIQSDPDWGAQQGSPRDPQPGGRPNKRDAVSIGNVGVRTPGPAPMTLDPGSESAAADPATLDAPTLALLVESGKAHWTTTLGAGDPRLALFDGFTVALDDLPGLTLGVSEGTTITIDVDGAGYGWFADGFQELDGRVDVLTVVEHELGHALGFEHEDAVEHEVMRETIALIIPPSAPDLTTDTGFSAVDNITNDNTPTFAGTAVAGFVVSFFDIFFDITTDLGSVLVDDLGGYTFTVSTALSDGARRIKSRASDGLGNHSDFSAELLYMIDTLAPAVPVLDLPVAEDSGSSGSDNVTNAPSWHVFPTSLVRRGRCLRGRLLRRVGTRRIWRP